MNHTWKWMILVLLISTPTWGVELFPDTSTTNTTIDTQQQSQNNAPSIQENESLPIIKSAEKTATNTVAEEKKKESGPTQKAKPVVIQDKAPIKVAEKTSQPKPKTRYVSFYVEPVINRGDFRLSYEVSDHKEWSTVLMAHLNPHPNHKKTTGQYGIYGGVRYKIDAKKSGPYVQGLGGLNYEADNSWNLGVELSGGYTFMWRESVALDIGAAVYRSYATTSNNADFAFLLNLVIGLDKPFLPFL